MQYILSYRILDNMYNYTCVAEYIWLDSNKKFRSKTKVIPNIFSGVFSADGNDVGMYPRWDYDGSSTGQASGTNTR